MTSYSNKRHLRTAIVLWATLGWAGSHRYYLGERLNSPITPIITSLGAAFYSVICFLYPALTNDAIVGTGDPDQFTAFIIPASILGFFFAVFWIRDYTLLKGAVESYNRMGKLHRSSSISSVIVSHYLPSYLISGRIERSKVKRRSGEKAGRQHEAREEHQRSYWSQIDRLDHPCQRSHVRKHHRNWR